MLRMHNLSKVYRTGEVEVLSSCMIISEGTDIPSVGGAILMRPTASFRSSELGRNTRRK